MAKNIQDDILTLINDEPTEKAPRKRAKSAWSSKASTKASAAATSASDAADTSGAENSAADSFRSEESTGVKHFSARENAFSPVGTSAERDVSFSGESSVKFYNESGKAERPSLDGYEGANYDESSLSNLYSDSGKTVCMVMRVVSTLLFILAPLNFIGRMFAIFGGAEAPTPNAMISSFISALISSILFVIGAFLVVALIKILQNLMALQKKK